MSWPTSAWYPAESASRGARILALPLAPFAGGFAAAVAARNFLFDAGVFGARRVAGLRVLSVGNLTVGGAGKTPVVAYLAERLSRRGTVVAVLSRGYGRASNHLLRVQGPPWPTSDEVGDEPLLLARRLPAVQVWVGADRVALAEQAQAAGATVALLDDGFQHRRLARDADWVVVDEAVGVGSGHLLPWGPLREPASALRRASMLWVRVAKHPVPLPPTPAGLQVIRARHAALDVLRPDGTVVAASHLAGVRVLAFCGIARPEAFGRTLLEIGAQVTALQGTADHHRFGSEELSALRSAAKSTGAELVTTEKDAMRLPEGFPASVVRLGVSVLEGEALLARTLEALAPAPEGER